MKYESCDHYDGKCPCYSCDNNCCGNYSDEEGNAIDTDILCKKAKKYCESGRKKERTGKVILVLDVPISCDMCDFVDERFHYCNIPWFGKDVSDYVACRHEDCPLKPIPEKKQGSSAERMYANEYCEGWNDCIDEITGN